MKFFGPLLGFMLMCFLLSTDAKPRINCRKYIYAPVCRGVAAKRAIPRSLDTMSEETRELQPYYGEFGLITLLASPSKDWQYNKQREREIFEGFRKKTTFENPEYDNSG